jgi:hypothetical protein
VVKPALSPDWDEPASPSPPKVEADLRVNVKCIVHTRPNTHEGPLSFGQTALVPPKVAQLMIERKQVEKV